MNDETMRRFLEKVRLNRVTGCWDWTASLDTHGYGILRVDGRNRLVHRLSYEFNLGQIPSAMCVCHRCDNPACVNPDHLFLGTHAENMADRKAKGRGVNMRGVDHGRAKLTEADVLTIRSAGACVKHEELARQFGINGSTIARIRSGVLWAHLNCHPAN